MIISKSSIPASFQIITESTIDDEEYLSNPSKTITVAYNYNDKQINKKICQEKQLAVPDKPSTFDPYPYDLIQQKSGVISLGHSLRLLLQHIAVQRDSETKSPEYDKFNDIFEIARVEGYGDTSYIISSLKDIKRGLSNNEFETAVKKIAKLLNDVMPFDYLHFFELFKATKKTADRLKDRVCWVLLGPTGIKISLYSYFGYNH